MGVDEEGESLKMYDWLSFGHIWTLKRAKAPWLSHNKSEGLEEHKNLQCSNLESMVV